jgi:hypothetical protein
MKSHPITHLKLMDFIIYKSHFSNVNLKSQNEVQETLEEAALLALK